MADKDEEITVDFSKLTSFFKGKKSSEKAGQARDKTSQYKAEDKPQFSRESELKTGIDKEAPGEEISLDFSKLKGIFMPKTGSKSVSATKRKDEEESGEVGIDLGKLKTTLKKINPNWLMLLLVLIPLILGVYIRMQTLDMHATDTWAKNTVQNYYQNSILAQINQQYPNLPDTKKSELVASQMESLLKTQKSQIDSQTAELSAMFKQQFKDDNGNNLMPDIDSYYWLRFIENVNKNGNPGDEIRDGQPYDNHYQSPYGRIIPEDEYFHIYLGYYFYKALSLINKSIIPMTAFSYLPVFLFALCIVFIFFITRKIAGNEGGFFAAMLLAVVPFFVSKSAFGYADTDIEVVFFPLLITFLFMEAYEAHNLIKTLILGTLAGLIEGVFSLTWGGWWYIFDFLVGATGLYLIYTVVVHRKTLSDKGTKHRILELATPVGVFFLSTLAFFVVFRSWIMFTNIFTGPFGFTTLKSVATQTIWPNVYTTVAEQNVVPLSDLIQRIGGTILFVLSIIGIFLTLLKKDKRGMMDPKYALLLIIWFLSTLYASTKGMRFILLIVPAFSVAFGVFVGFSIKYVSEFLEKELSIKKTIGAIALVLVFTVLLIPGFKNANDITTQIMPDVSRAWVNALTTIKTNSTQDAVINSWWDYGHWFKYFADRPVTFDGTSQQTPRAHWIGKVLLTSDEDEAKAILRMLDCGGDFTSMDLLAKTNDSLSSVKILKQVLMLDRDDAYGYLLKSGVAKEDAAQIADLTHCEPPEDYFITSEDMVSKSGVWAHFGSWDFDKADMVLRVKSLSATEGKQLLMQRYNLSTQLADKYYYEIQTTDANQWIAGWPSYASTPSACIKGDELITCDNGLRFNLSDETAYADTTNGRMYPGSYSFIDEEGNFQVKTSNESLLLGSDNKPLGAAVYEQDGKYYNILMSPELTGCMFTRLFYFGGKDMTYFRLFTTENDIRNLKIIVWKVVW